MGKPILDYDDGDFIFNTSNNIAFDFNVIAAQLDGIIQQHFDL